MTTSNFNVQDFLFENNIKIEEEKPQDFDFINFWNTELMTGEYIEVSEFVEACKLIVLKNSVANSIQSCDNQHEMKSDLTNLIGDITPAAAAVANADHSPLMETPLLDNSCMNTPFTPMLFTPQTLNTYSPSVNLHQAMDGFTSTMDSQLDDVNIANYLKNDSPWQDNITTTAIPETPAITTDYLFGTLDSSVNVSPTELLLNNNSSDDSLFPPITSDQHQDLSYALNNLSNPTDDLFLDTFDDIFQLQNEVTHDISKKRKHQQQQQDNISKSIKRVKLSVQKPTSDKDEKRFECEICHAKFSRRYNLGTHVKTHNKNRSKDFACTTCNKSFDRKHDLTRHVSTVHNGERAFGCSDCSSFFSRKDALVRHRIQKHHYES